MSEPQFGVWPPGAGDSSDAALTAVGWAQLALGLGAESIVHQAGGLFDAIVVNAPGEYSLTLSPTGAALLTNPALINVAGVVGQFGEAVVVVFPSLVEDLIYINTFNADGDPAAVARVFVTVFYDAP